MVGARKALLVGVAEYEYLDHLKYSVRDVETLAGALETWCGFEAAGITAMTCGKPRLLMATARNIDRRLDELGDGEPPELFVFAFAGHGERDAEGNWYLATRFTEEGDLERTALPLQIVRERVKRIGAENTLLILDCCQEHYSTRRGAATRLDPGFVEAGDLLAREIVGRGPAAGRGEPTVAVLMSCRPGQCAYEDPDRGQGIFTAEFVQALAETRDADNRILLPDVVERVRPRVVETARRLGRVQEPTCEVKGPNQKMVLGKADGCPAPIPSPPPAPRPVPSPVVPVIGSRCGNCGAAVAEDESYCRQCGRARLTECGACGRRVDREGAYCGQCGADLVAILEILRFWESVNSLEESGRTLRALAELNGLLSRAKSVRLGAAESWRELWAEQQRRLRGRWGVGYAYSPEALARFEELLRLPEWGSGFAARNAQGMLVTRHAKTGLRFVLIPEGDFLMGSPETEAERGDDEVHHSVTIRRAFLLSQGACTQGAWDAGGGVSESHFKGADLPVESVTWAECSEWCARNGLRLPSESEWEYACRAGTTTPFSFGGTIHSSQVNCDCGHPYGGASQGEFRKLTVKVGSLPANPWGLFEMHGNVWEWCEDWAGPYAEAPCDGSARTTREGLLRRVCRGGSWDGVAGSCRSAVRCWDVPGNRYSILGFRPAASLP